MAEVLWLSPNITFYLFCWLSQPMCVTDKPFKASLCYAYLDFCCVHVQRPKHPSSVLSAEREAVSHGSVVDAAFMSEQSLCPCSPSVVTEDNEFHNICHLLTLFGVTDLFLIQGFPTRVQLRGQTEVAGSHSLRGGAEGGADGTQTTVFNLWSHCCFYAYIKEELFV